MELKQYIRDIPDFPKQGIGFKDLTPLFGNANALRACAEQLANFCPVNSQVTKVIGIEARGFIMGGLLAQTLQVGFVPVRKKGKLPYKTRSKSYGLEYGHDVLEIHEDAIEPGDNVIIHDDVLATGGTSKAVCDLVRELGGNIVQCNFIIELEFLGGRKILKDDVCSVIRYA